MTAAEPCSICGTTGGGMAANSHRPSRTSLARFGLGESACPACYDTVRKRHLRGADPATGEPRKRPGKPREARP